MTKNVFEDKESAEKHLEENRQLYIQNQESVFCPLARMRCVPNCECYCGPSAVQFCVNLGAYPKKYKFRVNHAYCTNAMFTGNRYIDNMPV